MGDRSAVTVLNPSMRNTVRPVGNTLVSLSFLSIKLIYKGKPIYEIISHSRSVDSASDFFEKPKALFFLPFQVLTMLR